MRKNARKEIDPDVFRKESPAERRPQVHRLTKAERIKLCKALFLKPDGTSIQLYEKLVYMK